MWGRDPIAEQPCPEEAPNEHETSILPPPRRSDEPGQVAVEEPFAVELAVDHGRYEARFVVTFEDWIFGLHVTMAALLVGSLVMSWIVIVSLLTTDTPRLTLSLHRVKLVATGATIIGLLGTISLGIWTAILRIDFHPWDGWVIAAYVLWGIATILLVRSFTEFDKSAQKARALIAFSETGPSAELVALNRTSTGLLLSAVASLAIVLIVIDMIWKPGH
jgi:hypothetical protein